jgi:hypothetical protein
MDHPTFGARSTPALISGPVYLVLGTPHTRGVAIGLLLMVLLTLHLPRRA